MQIRRLVAAAGTAAGVAGLALGASGGVAMAAGSGYGGAPPAPGPTGAFSSILVVKTIGPAGGSATVTVDGATLTVTVPAGDFSSDVQLVISSGNLTQLTNVGGTPLVAFGTQVDQGGAKLPGPFAHPIVMQVTDSSITSSTVVDEVVGSTVTPASGWTVGAGSATGSFTTDPDYVLSAPAVATGAPIPGATTATTGKPFAGEELAAGALAAIGLGSGLAWRRARRRATA